MKLCSTVLSLSLSFHLSVQRCASLPPDDCESCTMYNRSEQLSDKKVNNVQKCTINDKLIFCPTAHVHACICEHIIHTRSIWNALIFMLLLSVDILFDSLWCKNENEWKFFRSIYSVQMQIDFIGVYYVASNCNHVTKTHYKSIYS